MIVIRIEFSQFGEHAGRLQMEMVEAINQNNVEMAVYEAMKTWISESIGVIGKTEDG